MTTLTAPTPATERPIHESTARSSAASSTIDVPTLAPEGYQAWDTYAGRRHLISDGNAAEDRSGQLCSVGAANTFFHTTAWMASVGDTFGHRPRYLRAQRDGRIVDILPMFEIRSLLAGRL